MAFLYCEIFLLDFSPNWTILSHFVFWHLLAFIKAQRPKFFVVSHIAFHFAHNANGQIKIGTGPNTEILHFAKCQTEQPLLSFSILRVKLGSRVCGWGIFGKKWREFFIDSVDSELESSGYTDYQNSR